MAKPSPPDNDQHNHNWRVLQQTFAEAMWTWAEVETATFTIYLAAIGALELDMRPIRTAFFEIQGFKMRMDMTHAAVMARWSNRHPYTVRWNALRKRCDIERKARNTIAHVSGHFVSAQNKAQTHLYVLLPPFWHSRSAQDWNEAKATGIDTLKLMGFAATWHKLGYDLHQFGLHLWSEKLRAASPPQSTHPSLPQSNKAVQISIKSQLPPES